MNWLTAIVVYILVWFVTLFAVLPWWVNPTQPGELGYESGAPQQPRLWLKAAVTTGIAALIWLGIYVLVKSPWFSFRGS